MHGGVSPQPTDDGRVAELCLRLQRAGLGVRLCLRAPACRAGGPPGGPTSENGGLCYGHEAHGWGDRRQRVSSYYALLGLADILFVVATAARLAAANPESMAALLRLPLSLLPTFLVPLIIASHVVLGVRLARQNAVR